MTLLAKDRLKLSIVTPKRCQLFLRDFDVLSAIVQAIPFPQFFSQQLEFALRAPGEFRVGTITLPPAAINVGVADADVKWIVTDLDLGSFYGWITHGLAPVIQVIHSDADARFNLYFPLPDSWEGCFEQRIVVLNVFVESLPITLQTQFICLSWRHSQRRMPRDIIFFVSPVLYSFSKARKRPNGLSLWVSRFGHHPWLSRRLGIAQQMVQELRFHGPKQPFLGRSETWLSGGPLVFTNPVNVCYLSKANTLTPWTSIHSKSTRSRAL